MAYNAAVTDSWVAASAFIAGGVIVAGGLVWYLVARSQDANRSARATAWRVRFFVAPIAEGGMVGLGGVM